VADQEVAEAAVEDGEEVAVVDSVVDAVGAVEEASKDVGRSGGLRKAREIQWPGVGWVAG